MNLFKWSIAKASRYESYLSPRGLCVGQPATFVSVRGSCCGKKGLSMGSCGLRVGHPNLCGESYVRTKMFKEYELK